MQSASLAFQSSAGILQYLAGLLSRLTADLNLDSYVRHYARDFPLICPGDVDAAKTGQMKKRKADRLNIAPETLPRHPPDVHQHLKEMLFGTSGSPSYPVCRGFAARTREMALCYSLMNPAAKSTAEVS